MPRAAYSVSAPSRIHFGLFAVGNLVVRKFGGIGLMIDSPRTILQVSERPKFLTTGIENERVRHFAQKWFSRYGQLLPAKVEHVDQLPCQLELLEQPPSHQGLGSGTQLAMTTATALFRYFGLSIPKPDELALTMGRAKRSAIGTNGFFSGGFLVDRGNTVDSPVAPLDFQIDFPNWPILLVTAHDHHGVSGGDEATAFETIKDVTPEAQQKMIDQVNDLIVPAVAASDYERFAESIYKYGHQSGMFYEEVQGGPYNGAQVTQLVNAIRDCGVKAVGQSSWGPSVYAICKDATTASKLFTTIDQNFGSRCDLNLTHACNRGVVVTALSTESN